MRLKGIVIGFVLGCSVAVNAETPVDELGLELVKYKIRRALPGTQFTAIEPTPIKGLYMLVAGSNVLYADETGTFLVVGGHVYNWPEQKDLTEERLVALGVKSKSETRSDRSAKQIDAVKVDELFDPNRAIVVGKNGDPRVAVFVDPKCGFCGQFHHDLLTNNPPVQVYLYLAPIYGGEESRYISQQIWCSENRLDALTAAYSGQQLGVRVNCDTRAIDVNKEFSVSIGIKGTPTMIREDGQMVEGRVSNEFLVQWASEVTVAGVKND